MRGFESLPPLDDASLKQRRYTSPVQNRMADEIKQLSADLERRTTERDYHRRMADKLADIIKELRPALIESERFLAYFANETGGHFVGPGTPTSCLAQIRRALAVPE